MSEGEDMMRPSKIFSGIVDTLRDTYGSVVSVSQVEEWLMESGFEPRDVKPRFSGEPNQEFVKRDMPLVLRVKSTTCLAGIDFATLMASTTTGYIPSFMGYLPLN
jgi:hypothetical protein